MYTSAHFSSTCLLFILTIFGIIRCPTEDQVSRAPMDDTAIRADATDVCCYAFEIPQSI